MCIVNSLIDIFDTLIYNFLIEWRLNMAIKVHLSRIMGEKRIKISELADMTGLHRNGITKLYNEKTDGIKFDTLEKLCRALDCSVGELIEIIEDGEK